MHHDNPFPRPDITVTSANFGNQQDAPSSTVDEDDASDDEGGEDADDDGDDGEHYLSVTMDLLD